MSNLVESQQNRTDPESDPMETPAAETQRIIRSGTIWLAAVLVAASVGLGPLLASGWRPSHLPMLAALGFWLGVVSASAGAASLIWAGCPTLGFPLMQAWKQKQYCIRFGICSSVGGMALVGLMILVTPA